MTSKEFANGYTIYVFDMIEDKDVTTPQHQGHSIKNLGLDLTFVRYNQCALDCT